MRLEQPNSRGLPVVEFGMVKSLFKDDVVSESTVMPLLNMCRFIMSKICLAQMIAYY